MGKKIPTTEYGYKRYWVFHVLPPVPGGGLIQGGGDGVLGNFILKGNMVKHPFCNRVHFFAPFLEQTVKNT